MNQLAIYVIFYGFALLAILCAFGVVIQSNPVRCVLFLVATFICMSVLWLLQEAEFLALILILVYVGAVMTLFLFVIMMLNIDIESQKKKRILIIPMAFAGIAVFIGLMSLATTHGFVAQQQTWTKLANTQALGQVLYTDYLLAFELAAMLLLVAIIAAITLIQRQLRRGKRQSIAEQLLVNPQERLTMLSMPSVAHKKNT